MVSLPVFKSFYFLVVNVFNPNHGDQSSAGLERISTKYG